MAPRLCDSWALVKISCGKTDRHTDKRRWNRTPETRYNKIPVSTKWPIMCRVGASTRSRKRWIGAHHIKNDASIIWWCKKLISTDCSFSIRDTHLVIAAEATFIGPLTYAMHVPDVDRWRHRSISLPLKPPTSCLSFIY